MHAWQPSQDTADPLGAAAPGIDLEALKAAVPKARAHGVGIEGESLVDWSMQGSYYSFSLVSGKGKVEASVSSNLV